MFRESIISILKHARTLHSHDPTLRSVFVRAALIFAFSLTWSINPSSAASESSNKIDANIVKQLQDLANQLQGVGLGYKVTPDNMARYCIDVEKANKIATQIRAIIEPLTQEHPEKLSPGLIKMDHGAVEIQEGHTKAVQACAKTNHPMNVEP
jgi:hypothetical protein